MFTGIIEALASVKERTDEALTVERPADFNDIKIGSSVCVSGACLSVTQFDDASMIFDVIPETWKRTKLKSLQKNDKVNLERAMQMRDRFEGHMVQGHVEDVGTIKRFVEQIKNEKLKMKNAETLVVEISDEHISFCIPKGSIALDGVSLTIASIKGNEVTVALIPHTLENTTLGLLKEGDQVNIETDMLVRAVRHFHSSSYS